MMKKKLNVLVLATNNFLHDCTAKPAAVVDTALEVYKQGRRYQQTSVDIFDRLFSYLSILLGFTEQFFPNSV